ncbi:MAG: hotdog fold thioesterase [Saprospiraceae bacterium]
MVEENLKAALIVDKMYNHDPFSQWLGIKRVADGAGKSVLQLEIREEMLNGFAIAHGGIAYALADSALAFAANGHGQIAMSIETSIAHTKQVKLGDLLTATAEEESLTTKTGIYIVRIKNQRKELVALFKGTVYRTSKTWEI